MLSRLRIFLVLLLVGLPLLITNSCSDNAHKKEKSAVEQQTDKTAQEAVKMIKTPLNEAKTAAKTQEDYGKKVKKAVTQ